MNLEIGATTDVGKQRKTNEDCFAVDPELGLLIVADGMGGHNAGEIASRLAVQAIVTAVRGAPAKNRENAPARKLLVESAVQLANRAVHDAGQSEARCRGMGTTVVLALASGDTVTIAHVGDSRAYLFGKDGMVRLTQDHSVVAEQQSRGLVSHGSDQGAGMGALLTRAIGDKPQVKVDVQDVPLSPGDVLLLASDGLTKMVPEETIAFLISAFRAQSGPMSQLVETLVRRANEAGGSDNVTIICARRTGSLGGRAA